MKPTFVTPLLAAFSILPFSATADAMRLNLSVNPALQACDTNYHTVHEAVEAALKSASPSAKISVAPGKYTERVNIPRSNVAIEIHGTGKKCDDVWIGEGANPGGFHATLMIGADNVSVSNLTLENTGGQSAGVQSALFVTGRKNKFENVAIKSWQDTLALWDNSVSYFHKCAIFGSVDFIYGGGGALFDQCEITEIRSQGGPVAAPSTPKSAKYGFVFIGCSLKPSPTSVGLSLMRPWYPNGMTAYINCKMEKVSDAGWDAWDGKEKTCRAFEYGSVDMTGKPIDLSKRSAWCKMLTSSDLADYTPEKILGGWNPKAP